jgi:hypothetical protein
MCRPPLWLKIIGLQLMVRRLTKKIFYNPVGIIEGIAMPQELWA